MPRKGYTTDEVIRALSKKKDVRIKGDTIAMLSDFITDKAGNTIRNPHKINDIGNKSWGKIDYLVNHCHYSLVRVASF